MSITQWWRRLRGETAEKLIEEAKGLRGLIPMKGAASELSSQLGDLSLGIDAHERWTVWRRLVRADQASAEKLNTLGRCSEAVKLGEKIELKQSDLVQFLECFERLGTEVDSLSAVREELNARKEEWQELQNEVRDAIPPAFVTHALIRLSDASGVELASLFIGALIGLGAIKMIAFYCAAVGDSMVAYWTLDDLIVQGISVLFQVLLALMLVELLFYSARRLVSVVKKANTPYVAHWWILRHPVRLIMILVVAMLMMVWFWGQVEGSKKRNEFLNLRALPTKSAELKKHDPNNSPRLATVADGTILNEVFLVGTTSRTAVLFQVTEWGQWRDVEEDRTCLGIPTPTSTVEQGFADDAASVRTTAECVSDYDVLVMDRAQIVCLSLGTVCLNQERRKANAMAEVKDERAEVELSVDSKDWMESKLREQDREQRGAIDDQLNQHLDSIQKHLNKHVAEVNAHVDRHLALVKQQEGEPQHTP